MISEEISYSELYNYRKDLVNWRYRGPINTIQSINELKNFEYSQNVIQKSKIIKSIKIILKYLKEN